MSALREWARGVLEGVTLAEKLRPPPPAFDRGTAEASTHVSFDTCIGLDVPGRPPELAFPTGSPHVAFPRDLSSPQARGVVLHFFANHELLALELMARAILRFPEASASFHAGLVGVMRDEQRHLSGYLGRMEPCGVPLGTVPVNRYFWDALAHVDDPLAFVSGLSLTFEQANLDFAHHYARAFRQAGDEDTALVLDGVLQDEIRHVRHGLAWFDRWRAPNLSRWEAWVGALPHPLTPSRARGTVFVEGPRLEAGLEEDMILRLRVYGASRGRPPRVLTFHPEVEAEVAGLPAAPVAAKVAADLAPLMIFLAAQDDVVITPRAPSEVWLAELLAAGFPVPEVCEGAPAEAARLLAGRKLGGLRPWGASPQVDHQLAPLREQLCVGSLDGSAWDTRWRRAYDKGFALGLLREMATDEPLIHEACIGFVCHSSGEIDAALDALRGASAVYKAPLSTAGRGLRRVDAPDTRAFAEATLQVQGSVIVEPWLERVLDLSVQLDVAPGGEVRPQPWGRFLTDHRGRYKGAVVGHARGDLSPEERRALAEAAPLLQRAALRAGAALHDLGYVGPAGIDAMLYREEGALRCRPLVEINPRLTMGRVAASLGRRVLPGKVGLVRQVSRREAGKALGAWASELRGRAPLRVGTHGGAPLIEAGAFFTTDPSRAVDLLGVMIVAGSLAEAEALLRGDHADTRSDT